MSVLPHASARRYSPVVINELGMPYYSGSISIHHIHDFGARLARTKIYNKIDLMTANHQIPVASSDIPKTAITTPFGLFEFVRMPYGLKNGAQSFQRFMDEVKRRIPLIFIYLDDILVASRRDEEHKQHFRLLFERLDEQGLLLNPQKYISGVEGLDNLGYHISHQGTKPPESRVQAIKDFPSPTSLLKLRGFLGLIKCDRCFVPSCAQVRQPLTNLLPGDWKKPPTFRWCSEHEHSFQEAKAPLATAVLLNNRCGRCELAIS